MDKPLDGGPLASGENGFIKSPKELLIIAERKVGELENRIRQMEAERDQGIETIEKMKWQNAQLRIGVTSLAKHHNHTPDEVKKIYDAYCDEQNAEMAKLSDDAKTKFVSDLKAGKVPDLKVVDRATGKVVEFPKPEQKG